MSGRRAAPVEPPRLSADEPTFWGSLRARRIQWHGDPGQPSCGLVCILQDPSSLYGSEVARTSSGRFGSSICNDQQRERGRRKLSRLDDLSTRPRGNRLYDEEKLSISLYLPYFQDTTEDGVWGYTAETKMTFISTTPTEPWRFTCLRAEISARVFRRRRLRQPERCSEVGTDGRKPGRRIKR